MDGTRSGRYGFRPNRSHRNEHNDSGRSVASDAGRSIADSGKRKADAHAQPPSRTTPFADESYGNSPYSQPPPRQHPLK